MISSPPMLSTCDTPFLTCLPYKPPHLSARYNKPGLVTPPLALATFSLAHASRNPQHRYLGFDTSVLTVASSVANTCPIGAASGAQTLKLLEMLATLAVAVLHKASSQTQADHPLASGRRWSLQLQQVPCSSKTLVLWAPLAVDEHGDC